MCDRFAVPPIYDLLPSDWRASMAESGMDWRERIVSFWRNLEEKQP
jgi:hypothetical protein